ncbi:MAG: SGNH/GDSL hydrolase family protein [Gemmatales bacterium]|nr:SGNH/GDSL hydrolase family protein [Gemmatales bacterium]
MGYRQKSKDCLYWSSMLSSALSIALLVLLHDDLVPAESVAGEKTRLADGDRVVYYGNTLLERDRHYGMLETMFRTRFPGRKLSFRNLAWPGDTVYTQLRPLNFGSMEHHLRERQPTLILVSFGMSEAYQGKAGLENYIRAYRKQLNMLRSLKAQIVVLSPIRQESLGPPLPDPKPYNENVALYHQATRQLAEEFGVPYIDLYSTLITSEPSRVPLTENGIHLNRYGYWRLSEVLAEQMGWTEKWEVVLDHQRQLTITVKGTRLQNLQWSADGLSFTAHDTVLPHPAPEGSPPHADEQAAHRRLVVHGLADGKYQLLADNQIIAEGSAKQWSQGMVLSSDPTYQQVRKLREIAIEKDLLFFHRWRAHNGEYIYGRRSKPGGGNSGNPTFPSEFAEFERLLSEADRRLDDLATPRAIQYRLRRISP